MVDLLVFGLPAIVFWKWQGAISMHRFCQDILLRYGSSLDCQWTFPLATYGGTIKLVLTVMGLNFELHMKNLYFLRFKLFRFGV